MIESVPVAVGWVEGMLATGDTALRVRFVDGVTAVTGGYAGEVGGGTK